MVALSPRSSVSNMLHRNRSLIFFSRERGAIVGRCGEVQYYGIDGNSFLWSSE